VDRFRPARVVLGAGVLVGASWIINAVAGSLALPYLGNVLGGCGFGRVYGACIGPVLKWFPQRRGLAAGLRAAGLGIGPALSVAP
jgi:OFA family oxalate/formate antiporter-like MFS transporter